MNTKSSDISPAERLQYVDFRSYDSIENFLLILEEYPSEKSQVAYMGMKMALDLWNIPAFEMFQEKSDVKFLRTGHRLSLLDGMHGKDKESCFVDRDGVEHNLCATTLEEVYWKSIEQMDSHKVLFVELEKLSKKIPNASNVLHRLMHHGKVNLEDADPHSVFSLILFLRNKNEEAISFSKEDEFSFKKRNYWNNPDFFAFSRSLIRAALEAYGEPENQKERREVVATELISRLLSGNYSCGNTLVDGTESWQSKKTALLGWSALVCEEAARYTSDTFIYSELSTNTMERRIVDVAALTYDFELLEKCLKIRFENQNKNQFMLNKYASNSGNHYKSPAGLMLELNRKVQGKSIPTEEKQRWEQLLHKSIEWTVKLGLSGWAIKEFESNEMSYDNQDELSRWTKRLEDQKLNYELCQNVKSVNPSLSAPVPSVEKTRF